MLAKLVAIRGRILLPMSILVLGSMACGGSQEAPEHGGLVTQVAEVADARMSVEPADGVRVFETDCEASGLPEGACQGQTLILQWNADVLLQGVIVTCDGESRSGGLAATDLPQACDEPSPSRRETLYPLGSGCTDVRVSLQDRCGFEEPVTVSAVIVDRGRVRVLNRTFTDAETTHELGRVVLP